MVLRHILLLVPALCLASCAGANNRQLTELQVELSTERELLKDTRAEMQALIKKLEPMLAMAELLSESTHLFGEIDDFAPAPEPSPPSEPYAQELVLDGGIVRVSDTETHITKTLWDDLLRKPEAMHGTRIVPSIKNGKADGMKLYAIRPSSIWAKFGFMNGDTVHRVNGMEIGSPEMALETFTKLGEASEILVDLTRRGKSVTLKLVIQSL